MLKMGRKVIVEKGFNNFSDRLPFVFFRADRFISEPETLLGKTD